jgi:hypothetical protein
MEPYPLEVEETMRRIYNSLKALIWRSSLMVSSIVRSFFAGAYLLSRFVSTFLIREQLYSDGFKRVDIIDAAKIEYLRIGLKPPSNT